MGSPEALSARVVRCPPRGHVVVHEGGNHMKPDRRVGSNLRRHEVDRRPGGGRLHRHAARHVFRLRVPGRRPAGAAVAALQRHPRHHLNVAAPMVSTGRQRAVHSTPSSRTSGESFFTGHALHFVNGIVFGLLYGILFRELFPTLKRSNGGNIVHGPALLRDHVDHQRRPARAVRLRAEPGLRAVPVRRPGRVEAAVRHPRLARHLRVLPRRAVPADRESAPPTGVETPSSTTRRRSSGTDERFERGGFGGREATAGALVSWPTG